MNLKQMIRNELDKDRGLANKIAEVAGFKNATPLYKFLNDADREMDNFNSLLKVVRYLFADREFEVMAAYCKTLDPNKKCARIAVEYAKSYRLDNLTKDLVEMLMNSKNAESKEWGQLYHIHTLSDNKVLSSTELIDMLTEIRIKTVEMKTYSRIIQIYNHFDQKHFDVMLQLADNIDSSLENISDEFTRKSFQCRVALIMVNIHLRNSSTEKAKYYAQTLLNNASTELYKSIAYLHLGNAHLLSNYDKSMHYLKLGLSVEAEAEHVKKYLRRSLTFLQNYWGKKPEFLDMNSDEIEDLHEKVFYYIKNNMNEDALQILDSIDLAKLNDNQKGFHFFYRGLMNNDRDLFIHSVTHFKLSGDKYYRTISLLELKRLGENEIVLHALSI